MKQIMMSFLTFFALTLISCSTDRDKCEHKGSDFVWSAEKGKCITKTQKEGEEKSKKDKGNATQAKVTAEQAECELKKTHQWIDGRCSPLHPANIGFGTVLFKSKNPNISIDTISVTATASRETKKLFDIGDCAIVTPEQFKSLRISVTTLGNEKKVLCDNISCRLGYYEVYYNPKLIITNIPIVGYRITDVDSAAQNCSSLEPTDQSY